MFDFIQRIESINVVAWVIGIFMKFSVYMYFEAEGMASFFKVKSNKYFIIPISVILFGIALFSKLSESVVAGSIVSYKVLPYIAFAVEFVIPLILLVIYLFRRKSFTCDRK